VYLSVSAVIETESSAIFATILIRLLSIVAALVWFRFLAAFVVRISVDQSIRIVQQEILHLDDPERIVLIGFSWGGAVSDCYAV